MIALLHRHARAISLVAGGLVWLLVNSPVEGPVLLVISRRHGITVADVASLAAFAAAGILVWRRRRPHRPPSPDGESASGEPLLPVERQAVVVGGLAEQPRWPGIRRTARSSRWVSCSRLSAFWGGEGAGARWPGSDAALLVLVPATALFALGLVAVFKRQRIADAATAPPLATVVGAGR